MSQRKRYKRHRLWGELQPSVSRSGGPAAPRRGRHYGRRLRYEPLEGRLPLAILTVNTLADGFLLGDAESPVVDLNAVPPIFEGGLATLTGSYRDIGVLDHHTATVNWGDSNNAADSKFAINAIKDGDGVVTLHVGDTFGSSTDAVLLKVTSINMATGKVGFSVQRPYLDDGHAPGNNTASDTSTLAVTVVNEHSQQGSNTTTVTVNNIAPTVTLNSLPPVNEGGTATLTGSYTDIGLSDVHNLTVNWGDWGDPNNPNNSLFTIPAIRNAAGNPTLAVGNTFSSIDGPITTTLTITAINSVTGKVIFSAQHVYTLSTIGGEMKAIVVTVADDDGESGDDSTSVVLPPALVGDYNRNSVVDAADYIVWRRLLGSTTDLWADGSSNGVVDQADYDVWRANFGNTLAAGSGSSSAPPASQPSPSAANPQTAEPARSATAASADIGPGANDLGGTYPLTRAFTPENAVENASVAALSTVITLPVITATERASVARENVFDTLAASVESRGSGKQGSVDLPRGRRVAQAFACSIDFQLTNLELLDATTASDRYEIDMTLTTSEKTLDDEAHFAAMDQYFGSVNSGFWHSWRRV